jgi:hypothetical protein
LLERSVLAEFFVDRQKDVIDEQKAIASVVGDAGNLVGMEAEIESVQDAAGARNSEKGFEVTGMVPHHGGDAIAGTET